MKDMMKTFGDSKFVPKLRSTKYELPREFWGEDEKDNLFVDIGKSMAFLYGESLTKEGFIDLDKAWTTIDIEELCKILLGDDAPPKQLTAMKKKIEDLRVKYPTPYQGHNLYYGFVPMKLDEMNIMTFAEKSDKNAKGEAFARNQLLVTFYIINYKQESLGYVKKLEALGGNVADKPTDIYSPINFFLDPSKFTLFESAVRISQTTDGEKRDVEWCYIISPGIKPKGKYLNGDLNDLWC